MKKRKELTVFYINEMKDIYNIIINNNISDDEKVSEIEQLGGIKKLYKSLTTGIYRDFDEEFKKIKEWFNEYNKDGNALNKLATKGNRFTENQIMSKLKDLLFLNSLYTNGLLNENTYYPIFKKYYKSLKNSAPKYDYLVHSKIISFEDEEVKNAVVNIDNITKIIEKFYTGKSLEYLNFRFSIEQYLEKNNYLENYNYAEFLIKSYINSNSCYRINDFISYFDISREQLEDCINIIKFLNPILYSEYLEKKEKDNKRNYAASNYIFKKLAIEIDDRIKEDNEMPILEFVSKTPFLKYYQYQKNENFDYLNTINEFIDNVNVKRIISNYAIKNKINIIRMVNAKSYLKTLSKINGHTLSDEDKDNILKILKYLNLASSVIVINSVATKYFNNEYNLDSLKNDYLSKINSIKEEMEPNPYVYIKKK